MNIKTGNSWNSRNKPTTKINTTEASPMAAKSQQQQRLPCHEHHQEEQKQLKPQPKPTQQPRQHREQQITQQVMQHVFLWHVGLLLFLSFLQAAPCLVLNNLHQIQVCPANRCCWKSILCLIWFQSPLDCSTLPIYGCHVCWHCCCCCCCCCCCVQDLDSKKFAPYLKHVLSENSMFGSGALDLIHIHSERCGAKLFDVERIAIWGFPWMEVPPKWIGYKL